MDSEYAIFVIIPMLYGNYFESNFISYSLYFKQIAQEFTNTPLTFPAWSIVIIRLLRQKRIFFFTSDCFLHRQGRGKRSLRSPSSYSFPANTNASSVLQEPVSKQANKQKQRNSVIITLQGDFSQQTVKHKVAPLLCKIIGMSYTQLSLHKINVFAQLLS